MVNIKYFQNLHAQVIRKILTTWKLIAFKINPRLVAFNCFWWNIIYKYVGWVKWQGLSAATLCMPKHITQVTI